jgi:hypothetical protein
MHILTSTRRYFIGGSDARIIMGNDEAALLRLWREKRPGRTCRQSERQGVRRTPEGLGGHISRFA